jgi:uncharacterized membrane protein
MTEVSTVITDYLLAGLTTVLAIALLRAARRDIARRLWGWAFLASALAALVGGTWHGFQRLLPEPALFWMWKAVVYSVGVFGLAAVSGTIIAASPRALRYWMLALMVAVTVTYGAFMATHDDFIYVIYFNAAAMSFVLVIHLDSWFRRQDPASPWIVAGVLVSGLAAVAQASGMSLHRNFNNNDLFHVIQMIGVYFLYRGARRLETVQPLG